MAELETELAGAIVAAQSQVSAPTSVLGIVATFGAGGRATAALARELHARMENPPQYASVRRNVERWLRTEQGDTGMNARRPGAEYRAALDKIGRERIDRVVFTEMLRDGLTARWEGEMLAGSSELDYSERAITVNIPAQDAAPIVKALRERDLVGAADAFNAAFFQSYGIEDAYITDTANLKIYVGDNRPVEPNRGVRL